MGRARSRREVNQSEGPRHRGQSGAPARSSAPLPPPAPPRRTPPFRTARTAECRCAARRGCMSEG
eukprot:1572992-Rhodomonas_salina.3